MTVPPEIDSPFNDELDSGGLDGYYTRAFVVTELMSWLGLSKPAAEDYLADQGAETAIEAIQSQVRRC